MEWVVGLMILWVISLFNTSGDSASSTNKKEDNSSVLKKRKHSDKVQKRMSAETRRRQKARLKELDLLTKEAEENVIDINSKLIKSPNSTDSELSPQRGEIKKYVEQRGIIRLLHFTRYENLDGIMNNGLYTRSMLGGIEEDTYINDRLRLDGHKDSISLSISFPNHKMFYKYRMNTNAKGWAVLVIDPSVLWEYDCAFCRYNAADSRISSRSRYNLSNLDSLKKMFIEDDYNQGIREDDRLGKHDPIDTQAEVLIFSNLPINKISYIGFEDRFLLSEFKRNYPSINSKICNQYFSTRRYVRSRMSSASSMRRHSGFARSVG